MPKCPKCNSKYTQEDANCPSCGVLVGETIKYQSKNTTATNVELVFLKEVENTMEADMLAVILKDNDIHCIKRHNSPGDALEIYTGSTFFGVKLYVSKDDKVKADSLLEELGRFEIEDDENKADEEQKFNNSMKNSKVLRRVIVSVFLVIVIIPFLLIYKGDLLTVPVNIVVVKGEYVEHIYDYNNKYDYDYGNVKINVIDKNDPNSIIVSENYYTFSYAPRNFKEIKDRKSFFSQSNIFNLTENESVKIKIEAMAFMQQIKYESLLKPYNDKQLNTQYIDLKIEDSIIDELPSKTITYASKNSDEKVTKILIIGNKFMCGIDYISTKELYDSYEEEFQNFLQSIKFLQ